jgi:hypothetical protein
MARYEQQTHDTSGHSEPLDLSHSLVYINGLNEKIKEKCPFIDISFLTKGHIFSDSKGFISYAHPGDYSLNYLLCLNIKGFCVSSIEIILEGDRISIDSATGTNFEGRGYNSFLRAVLVKISAAQGIKYIISLAKNKLSADLQTKLGAESVKEGIYTTTTLDVSKPENIVLANNKIDIIIQKMDEDKFCFDIDEDDIKILNPSDEGHFYINNFYGGSRRNKSRRNKSRRNKSRRNKSRRNKSRRNKSRRK